MKNAKNTNINITFPTLWLIPMLSLVYSIIRIYDGVDWNFATTIVIAPILTYLGWTFGYMICMFLSIFFTYAVKIIDKEA